MVDDATTIAALEQRVAQLEALVQRLAPAAETSSTTTRATGDDPPPSSAPLTPATTPTIGRRRLLGRAGTAAVGAVLGGTAVTIAAASPAAAATGSFDTSDYTPALTASTTGSGPAIDAIGGTFGAALHTIGPSNLEGPVDITVADATGLSVRSTGQSAGGITMKSDAQGALFIAAHTGLWAIADLAVSATGNKLGVLAAGADAQLLLKRDSTYFLMPPPLTRDDAHEAGEVYFDNTGALWLCTAAGTPGTWTRLGGNGTAGAFTVLASPVRVYDSRPGYSPSTGPKTKLAADTDRTIDCTTNSSGIPTDATAVVTTITITDPTDPGWLAVRANGAPYNGTSTLNWTTPGAITATTTTTAVGPAATIALRAHVPTNAIVDLIGYYR